MLDHGGYHGRKKIRAYCPCGFLEGVSTRFLIGELNALDALASTLIKHCSVAVAGYELKVQGGGMKTIAFPGWRSIGGELQ